ncbi:MAG: DUF2723 domain-containing protein [Bacteroidetes bacterium]|nr:DUF2723 domain-containing protein [Bacteroidota bacterium]
MLPKLKRSKKTGMLLIYRLLVAFLLQNQTSEIHFQGILQTFSNGRLFDFLISRISPKSRTHCKSPPAASNIAFFLPSPLQPHNTRMKNYNKINNLTGWAAFAVSAFVYLRTIEPTGSFWDCGEFIAAAFKLQVGHPPGAPLFLMIARFFTLFAGGDVKLVPIMVNVMSALSSAFTILFLFWSVTHLARKMVKATDDQLTMPQLLMIMGAGMVGALSYTFSDSFWFSAVEGEVYAMSAMFTAVVFWAMLSGNIMPMSVIQIVG